MLKKLITLAAALFAAATLSAQTQVHDPVAAYCDGIWYMFSTGYGIDIQTCKDLKKWERSGRVFQTPPAWAAEAVPGFRGHIWAPDILFHDGQYFLFYSCSTFGKNTSAIGVATNRTLNPESADYKWEDHGCVVRSVGGRDNWNAIDPNVVIDDEGCAWMSFGSFWSGIKLVKLDSSLTRPAEPQIWFPICRRPEGTAEDTSKTDTAIKADSRGSDFDPGNGAVEAPFIVRHGDFYYLFVSYDLCCRGANSTYKVVVGRSEKVTGPYIDADGIPLMNGGGTLVAGGDKRFPGVGHCAVVESEGKTLLFMHGYDKEHNYGSMLLIRTISWDKDGWPTVKI